MMPTLVLTGATGYIGRNLCEKLLDEGFKILSYSRPGSWRKLSERIQNQVQWIPTDLEAEELTRLLRDSGADCIVHLATYFVSEHKQSDVPFLVRSNIEMPAVLLEAASLAGIKKFLNIGTFWQHHDAQEYSPASLYAATKRAFEDILVYYSQVMGFSVINLKFAGVYGPSDPRGKIINLLFDAIDSGDPLRLSPGDQRVDLIYIDDAIEAVLKGIQLLRGLDGGKNLSFSVSSGMETTLKQLVEKLENVLELKIPVNWGSRAYREKEFFKDWMTDPALPNWTAKTSMEEGLGKILFRRKESAERNGDLHSSLQCGVDAPSSPIQTS